MERYEKYKSSGIEWIGEIPEHWEVKKLKYIAESNPSNIDKKSKDEEEEIFLCNYVDIYKNEFIKSGMNFMKATASKEQIKKFILQKGDVILTKDSESANDIGIPAFITETFDDVVCGYHLTHIKPVNISGEYLFRQFQCKFQQSYFEISANGVTRYGLGTDKFDSALIIIPSSSEQIHITAYLDCKTVEIDQIIANKQKLIVLYEEEKQAVINHTVTCGVDPNVHLKSSGVEWLGNIPEQWNLIKLKRISNKITDGEHISPTFTLEGMPFLSAKDVRDEYVQFDYDKFVNFEEGIKFRKRCNPEKGDVLIVSRGATVGRVAIVETDEQFCLLGSVILVKPTSQILNKYLLYSLKNKLLQDNFLLTSQSSAQQAIYLVNVSEIHLSIPLIDEQRFIVAHIEKESNRLDTFIEKCKKQIELLKEYRTTLISEVVTGKVKVT